MLIFNIPTTSIALKIIKWVFPVRSSLSQNQRGIINDGFHQIPPGCLPEFHHTNEVSSANCCKKKQESNKTVKEVGKRERRMKREKQSNTIPWKRSEWRWEEWLEAEEEWRWRKRKREKRKGKVKNFIIEESVIDLGWRITNWESSKAGDLLRERERGGGRDLRRLDAECVGGKEKWKVGHSLSILENCTIWIPKIPLLLKQNAASL